MNQAPAPFHPLWWTVATVFGSGYSPVASGTAGAAVGLLLYPLLGPLFVSGPMMWGGLAFLIALYVAGVLAGNWAETYFGKKDDGRVVIDEFLGFYICLICLPFGWKTALLAFFVSRIVDIIKPYPARDWQRFKGGTGIMIDDVIASIYGLFGLHLLRWLFPALFG